MRQLAHLIYGVIKQGSHLMQISIIQHLQFKMVSPPCFLDPYFLSANKMFYREPAKLIKNTQTIKLRTVATCNLFHVLT